MGRGRYKRVEEKHDSQTNQGAAKGYKYDERDRPGPHETERLNQQAEDHQDPRNAKPPDHEIVRRHQLPPSQNFTLLPQRPTLWTTSWQPLEMQDNLLAFTAGSVSGSAL